MLMQIFNTIYVYEFNSLNADKKHMLQSSTRFKSNSYVNSLEVNKITAFINNQCTLQNFVIEIESFTA